MFGFKDLEFDLFVQVIHSKNVINSIKIFFFITLNHTQQILQSLISYFLAASALFSAKSWICCMEWKFFKIVLSPSFWVSAWICMHSFGKDSLLVSGWTTIHSGFWRAVINEILIILSCCRRIAKDYTDRTVISQIWFDYLGIKCFGKCNPTCSILASLFLSCWMASITYLSEGAGCFQSFTILTQLLLLQPASSGLWAHV